jgi:hypothetical protein
MPCKPGPGNECRRRRRACAAWRSHRDALAADLGSRRHQPDRMPGLQAQPQPAFATELPRPRSRPARCRAQSCHSRHSGRGRMIEARVSIADPFCSASKTCVGRPTVERECARSAAPAGPSRTSMMWQRGYTGAWPWRHARRGSRLQGAGPPRAHTGGRGLCMTVPSPWTIASTRVSIVPAHMISTAHPLVDATSGIALNVHPQEFVAEGFESL